MIKATELRIGNIVSYAGELVKLSSHDIYQIDIGIGFCQKHEPLPLTPEILRKCGFINNANCTSLNLGEHSIDQFEDHMVFYSNQDVTAYHGFPIPCQYLHQLQNLYFALTGKELETSLS